jgi:hypothetical protein
VSDDTVDTGPVGKAAMLEQCEIEATLFVLLKMMKMGTAVLGCFGQIHTIGPIAMLVLPETLPEYCLRWRKASGSGM